MTTPDTARAFAAAEAAYLEPRAPECECACDVCENDLHCCQVDCHVNDEDFDPEAHR